MPLLLCYDGSAAARRAIETAGRLFPGYEAVVLHVWSPIAVMAVMYGNLVAEDDDNLKRAALEVSREGVQVATEAGLYATAEIAAATYAGTCNAILDVAEQHGVALIVVGTRTVSGFESMVVGSASHRIAQQAHRPVLIVPEPKLADQSTALRSRGVA